MKLYEYLQISEERADELENISFDLFDEQNEGSWPRLIEEIKKVVKNENELIMCCIALGVNFAEYADK